MKDVRFNPGDLVTFRLEQRGFPARHGLPADLVWRVIQDDNDSEPDFVYDLRSLKGNHFLQAYGYRLENSFLAKVAAACEKGKNAGD